MSEEKIGIRKGLEWKYENEVRFFFPEKGDTRPLSPEDRTLLYHPNDVMGIIFGPKVNKL